jgi:type II pantothenate kinase
MTRPGPDLGLDIGATLSKIARQERGNGAAAEFEFLPSSDLRAVAERVTKLCPERIGITGGGSARLSSRLSYCLRDLRNLRDIRCVNEFEAWGAGAAQLLAAREAEPTIGRPGSGERFLLVSLGTGTSILLIDGDRVTRVGGTALGGGTVVGLGRALTGAAFEELCSLAQLGSAAAVDLRVADIYGPGGIQGPGGPDQIALAGELTAANFGKLASRVERPDRSFEVEEASRADLAAGVMGLVGENVALICAGLAAASDTKTIVFGGSTVRDNPQLVEVVREVTTLCGLHVCFLPNGEFAGALGALELARAPA